MDQGWLSDNSGRIANISLAPNAKNAMYPLFEAIMNSIQSIEERFGPDNLGADKIERDADYKFTVEGIAFYTYFDSDRPFSAITGDKASGTDRPDLALFDLGLGFDSSDSTHPITIVEFKKPRRNNYTLSDNPIIQVRKYVEKLRAAGKAIKFDGTKLRNIDKDTPFMCYIVADIEPTLLEAMRNLGNFTQRAGTDSFYFWDPVFKIMIEVMSYDEVLSSAKARNQAFFARLGID